jgi:hypothetical protein
MKTIERKNPSRAIGVRGSLLQRTVQRLLKSGFARNAVTLHIKFALDTIRGRNTFVFFGNTVNMAIPVLLPPKESKKVLLPTAFYLDRGLAWQTTVAKALEVRGHHATFMPLDLRFARRNSLYFDDVQTCGFATRYYNLYTSSLLKSFRVSVQPYSAFGTTSGFTAYRRRLDGFGIQECRGFVDGGLPIGSMVLNSLIHHFRCSEESIDRPDVLDAYRDYIAIGLVLRDIINAAYDRIKPDVVFVLNGSFLDSQLHCALSRARSIRVVTFEAGFMLNSIVLGINEPAITFPMAKYLPEGYERYELTAEQNAELDDYLKARSFGKKSIFDYWGKPIFDHAKICQEVGIAPQTVPDILFTNLMWDSAMLNCDVAFSSQLVWIFDTIRYYRQHRDRTLLVRIHPAEIVPANLESTDKIAERIHKEFPSLPANVHIIPPASLISSYPLAQISNMTIVYSTTAGLESAIMGKPVVVCGKTHYRNRWFTHDIVNRDQYFSLLSNPKLPGDREMVVASARKYAYFFFFGFMIPFRFVTERPVGSEAEVAFNFNSEKELLAGQDAELDFVLEVILGSADYTKRMKRLMAE